VPICRALAVLAAVTCACSAPTRSHISSAVTGHFTGLPIDVDTTGTLTVKVDGTTTNLPATSG
jgi:hypothetical protein